MGKMMKNVLKKLGRDEKGQAFILVLIFLLVGGLIITPLLGFMSTGLKVGQMHEQKMDELYAADAGVEDALYKIINNDASLPAVLGESWTYNLADVNDKSVQVEIQMEEDVATFLAGMGLNDPGIHNEWTTITDSATAGTYTITVTYSGAASKKFIDGVGAWFRGDYEYVAGSASGITDDYPGATFEVSAYKGGTAFIWRWQPPASKPEVGTVPGVFTRTLTFEYTPAEIPALNLAWVEIQSLDIGTVPTSVTFGNYTVTATATDTATGEQTVVVAYPSWQGSGGLNVVDILAWEINPQ